MKQEENFEVRCFEDSKIVLSKRFKTIGGAIFFENTAGLGYEKTNIVPLNREAEDELLNS